MTKIEIPFRLPGLNEYTNANRANKYAGASLKKSTQEIIFPYVIKLDKQTKPVRIIFTWHEKKMRRDIDNVAFAQKFILDAMVKAGVLIDDSRKYVVGIVHDFPVKCEKDAVEVMILEGE